jgi:hypothetical protein
MNKAMKSMRKHIIFFTGMLTFLLVTLGCSPVKIIAEREENFQPSAYQSYAFAQVDLEGVDQATAILYEEISKRIAYEMHQKGYKLNPNDPDLLVAFNILSEEQRKEVWRNANNNIYNPWMGRGMWGYYGPWSPAMDTRYKEVKYEKTGTFVVDLLSVEQQELVWRGIGIGPVNNPEERFNTAYLSVEKMFRDFPAKVT